MAKNPLHAYSSNITYLVCDMSVDDIKPHCLNGDMLTAHDKVIIKEIVEKIVDERADRIENKIDKVLKIVTRSDGEHAITKAKVEKLDKCMRTVEKKLKIKPPAKSVIFS